MYKPEYLLNHFCQKRVMKRTFAGNGTVTSKGVCHKIFDFHFFHDSNPSRPLINKLEKIEFGFDFVQIFNF